MRVTIIAVGSRGDVQPYVALGVELARRGHAVTLATHAVFQPLVTAHGLTGVTIAGDPQGILAAAERWLVTGRVRDALASARTFLRIRGTLLTALLADYWRVSAGSDVLIYSTVAAPAWSVAERLGIPGIAAWLQPMHRTRAFPSIAVPHVRSLGATLNAASYDALAHLAWRWHRRAINTWRRDTLGLDAVPASGPFAASSLVPAIYGYSPRVVARPADWGAHIHVTGYWALGPEPGWEPPRSLAAFLEAGPAPIYVGFGSMTPRDADRLTAVAVQALARTGQRGILLGGWGGLGAGPLPDTIMAVRDVPHEWLFPRLRAIVHHGGAGTTGAALRAGVPSIVVPLGFDQPYWGRRVSALGVGPDPIARRRLTADRLARAIDRVLHDEAMRDRAAALGRSLSAERGSADAADVVERSVSAGPGLTR